MSAAKLFWQDPYQSRLDTRIAAVSGDDVTLAETIFYAFSGGQESGQSSLAAPTPALPPPTHVGIRRRAGGWGYLAL
jgi:hypothetical protein